MKITKWRERRPWPPNRLTENLPSPYAMRLEKGDSLSQSQMPLRLLISLPLLNQFVSIFQTIYFARIRSMKEWILSTVVLFTNFFFLTIIRCSSKEEKSVLHTILPSDTWKGIDNLHISHNASGMEANIRVFLIRNSSSHSSLDVNSLELPCLTATLCFTRLCYGSSSCAVDAKINFIKKCALSASSVIKNSTFCWHSWQGFIGQNIFLRYVANLPHNQFYKIKIHF